MADRESEQSMSKVIKTTLSYDAAGERLDQAISKLFPNHSRSVIQRLIKDGHLTVDGAVVKPSIKVRGGEEIVLEEPPPEPVRFAPQAIDLDVVYEDDHLLVVNKPAGLVVHPGAGNPDGTLVNALLHHSPQVAELPRAGLVHRLDKDTTGLLVVAKTAASHGVLTSSLEAREFLRQYTALCVGVMTAGGTIDAPIARHSHDRTRMCVRADGRSAVTRYRVEERFTAHSLLSVRLETGRTHQIRVHMAHAQYPIVGDPVYGGRLVVPRGASPDLLALLRRFKRQALHATVLGLTHPVTGEWIQWQHDPPTDMQSLIEALRAEGSA